MPRNTWCLCVHACSSQHTQYVPPVSPWRRCGALLPVAIIMHTDSLNLTCIVPSMPIRQIATCQTDDHTGRSGTPLWRARTLWSHRRHAHAAAPPRSRPPCRWYNCCAPRWTRQSVNRHHTKSHNSHNTNHTQHTTKAARTRPCRLGPPEGMEVYRRQAQQMHVSSHAPCAPEPDTVFLSLFLLTHGRG